MPRASSLGFPHHDSESWTRRLNDGVGARAPRPHQAFQHSRRETRLHCQRFLESAGEAPALRRDSLLPSRFELSGLMQPEFQTVRRAAVAEFPEARFFGAGLLRMTA